jgi:histidinol-phosphatase (PHP family)
MAFDREIPITFASDAHAPDQVGWKMHELKLLAREAGYTEAADYRNRVRQMHKF